ncbi:hypothetical protein LTR64_008692 [Lithohypha guttulata]|uniref:uncharacterized protein n=1 Tax=Lithohypha guttulata TaxID=1690604 RepID=UPI002DE161C8|nr:hypothetical protein LTR51_008701 [Lithohypha guttulata]
MSLTGPAKAVSGKGWSGNISLSDRDRNAFADGRKRSHTTHACREYRRKRAKLALALSNAAVKRLHHGWWLRVKIGLFERGTANVGSVTVHSLVRNGRRSRKVEIKGLCHRIAELQAACDIYESGHNAQDTGVLSAKSAGSPGDLLPAKGVATTSSAHPLLLPAEQISQIQTDLNARLVQDSQPDDQNYRVPETYTTFHLPPQDVVKNGAKFFFDVIEGLCYVITPDEFDVICDKVYVAHNSDMIDVTELCAISALGSQYLDRVDRVPNAFKDALLRTCVGHINNVIESSTIRGIRILVCICMYGIIEKRRTTRIVVEHALKLCRWGVEDPHSNGFSNVSSIRIKLYRSIIFLECWLATSLGYQPALTEAEVSSVMTNVYRKAEQNLNNSSQVKVTEVGLLKLRVLQEVYRPQAPTADEIEERMKELEGWHSTLPPFMTLSNLMAGKCEPLTACESGALMLAHAMYLGSVILLHHRILGDAVHAKVINSPLPWERSSERAHSHITRCIDGARCIARIFDLLGFGGGTSPLHLRCWLSVFEIFMATTILLCDVAVKCLTSSDDTTTTEDLKRASRCLQMLRASAEVDAVSRKLHETLHALYERLSLLRVSSHSSSTTATGWKFNNNPTTTPMAPDKKDSAKQLTRDVASVLRNPFGHGTKPGPNMLSRTCGVEDPDWWELRTATFEAAQTETRPISR